MVLKSAVQLFSLYYFLYFSILLISFYLCYTYCIYDENVTEYKMFYFNIHLITENWGSDLSWKHLCNILSSPLIGVQSLTISSLFPEMKVVFCQLLLKLDLESGNCLLMQLKAFHKSGRIWKSLVCQCDFPQNAYLLPSYWVLKTLKYIKKKFLVCPLLLCRRRIWISVTCLCII